MNQKEEAILHKEVAILQKKVGILHKEMQQSFTRRWESFIKEVAILHWEPSQRDGKP